MLEQVSIDNPPINTGVGATATCPSGYKVLTGGSFWANDAGGPSPDEADDATVAGSAPSRREWFGHGQNHTLAGGDLFVRAICIQR